ncbi:hypothetical protein J6590_055035 [Homalodisca vitripennis]|nr:hypothetical protein J6590_055035 [Homalodisca vitripennis]
MASLKVACVIGLLRLGVKSFQRERDFHIKVSKAEYKSITSEGMEWRCDPCSATRSSSLRLHAQTTDRTLILESESEETGPGASVSLGPGAGSGGRRELLGVLSYQVANCNSRNKCLFRLPYSRTATRAFFPLLRMMSSCNTILLGGSDIDIHHDSLNVFKKKD